MPGCFSAGDTLDEAMTDAREALALHLEILREEGQPIPQPRCLAELRQDPDAKADLDAYAVAVAPFVGPRPESATEQAGTGEPL